jgi:hypothetical protein
MSDLQLALIALGAVFVAAVAGYNVLQERKARRRAEAAFGGHRADPLLDPDSDRREPTIGGVPDEPAREPALGSLDELTSPIADPAPAVEPEPSGGSILSARIDSIALILADQPVTREQLEPLLDALAAHSAAVAVEGLVEEQWLPVSDAPGGAWRELRAGLQLASRAGPVPEEEIAAFNDTVAGFAASINGVSQRESPALAAARARELDRFCAEADFEVAVNVRTSASSPFGIARVKSLALEHGYAERGDGSFERRLPDGVSSTTLRYADPDAGGKAWVQGLTFALDVPLVPRPQDALADLAATAGEFARVLGGELVDDARKPLGPAGIAAIRRSLEQVAARMQAQGVPAGGALARRLFA